MGAMDQMACDAMGRAAGLDHTGNGAIKAGPPRQPSPESVQDRR